MRPEDCAYEYMQLFYEVFAATWVTPHISAVSTGSSLSISSFSNRTR
jgi:hypothetical protein